MVVMTIHIYQHVGQEVLRLLIKDCVDIGNPTCPDTVLQGYHRHGSWHVSLRKVQVKQMIVSCGGGAPIAARKVGRLEVASGPRVEYGKLSGSGNMDTVLKVFFCFLHVHATQAAGVQCKGDPDEPDT